MLVLTGPFLSNIRARESGIFTARHLYLPIFQLESRVRNGFELRYSTQNCFTNRIPHDLLWFDWIRAVLCYWVYVAARAIKE